MVKKIYRIIFLSFIAAGCTNSNAPESNKAEEVGYTIETRDIDNFWAAYDSLATSTDSARTFQEFYLDKASPYFQEFLRVRNFRAKEYAHLVRTMPEYWKTIRPLTEDIQNRKSELGPAFNKFRELYPAFKQPDVCFAIGALRTGGTVTNGLILIGAEIEAADQSVNLSEFEKGNFIGTVLQHKTGDIVGLVLHEAVHTQQLASDAEDSSLLKEAIEEGAADFIASLILNKVTLSKAIYDYGVAHERQLWQEFYADVKAGKLVSDTDWMYNYRSSRPADLGYFIGYRICEAYYHKASDKKQAIEEIIMMKNTEEFLLKSCYTEKFGS
ncbi:gliding motility protein GldB-related protein [Pontibacter flavimaris]|uniref:Uncharacterized protein n=1 Tax=Pontibacter flavimaris TaxID=1797110 RepID=A0A1Q5PG30_9BACT|nr:DUF2268 domain-containing putative Zn-dependent protease [Pontibacter flavimaris]OKL41184.1 hypothetical protein A3841_15305 [Pontibacter flavimaris]